MRRYLSFVAASLLLSSGLAETVENPFALSRPPLTLPSNREELTLKLIQQYRADIEQLRNLPTSPLTTPCWQVSKDSTFTKSWSFSDWEQHLEPSAARYARHLVSWFVSTTARDIIPTIILVAGWTVLLFKIAEKNSFNMSSTKFAMTLGFIQAPILLLLTLKTNRSLDRMLETRKAWGVLTRASRSFTGLNCAHIIPCRPEVGLLMARYLALIGWSMKAQFRKGDDETDMIRSLFERFPAEKEWLLKCSNKRPIAIVTRLRHLLAGLCRDVEGSLVPPVVLLRMEQILYDIEQTIGINTRVFVSPVPPTYTRHTSRVLVLYMLLMPGALVGSGVSLIPAIVTATFASYVLVGIDEIGLESKSMFFYEVESFFLEFKFIVRGLTLVVIIVSVEYPFHLLPMYSMSKNIMNEVENQVTMMERMLSFPRKLK